MRYVGRDPAPQQLHGRTLAIGGIDARASKLENFAWMGDERRNVVLGCGIKAPQTGCRLSPEQPVSSDNPVLAARAGVVEDQEVIAIIIEAIDVAPPPEHMGQRARSQRLIKYPVP
jgi:hypothetical protein